MLVIGIQDLSFGFEDNFLAKIEKDRITLHEAARSKGLMEEQVE